MLKMQYASQSKNLIKAGGKDPRMETPCTKKIKEVQSANSAFDVHQFLTMQIKH